MSEDYKTTPIKKSHCQPAAVWALLHLTSHQRQVNSKMMPKVVYWLS